MKKYFKRTAESDFGTGIVYLEFDGEWASRQVEVYGGKWFNSLRSYHDELGPSLADQPLSTLNLPPSDEISFEEFEVVWNESVWRVS